MRTVELVRGIDSPLGRYRVATCSACRKPTWVPTDASPWLPVACEVCARDLREPTVRRKPLFGVRDAPAPTEAPAPPKPRREGFWTRRRRRRAEAEALRSVAATVRTRAETETARREVAAETAAHLRRWEIWDDEDGARIAHELRADLAVLYPEASDEDLDKVLATFKQRTRTVGSKP